MLCFAKRLRQRGVNLKSATADDVAILLDAVMKELAFPELESDSCRTQIVEYVIHICDVLLDRHREDQYAVDVQ